MLSSLTLQHQEYEVIKVERRASLQTLKKVGFEATKVNQEEHCPWGLEQIQSRQHMQHFRARQKAIVQAVLYEQKYQRIISRPDPESLRLIASSFSQVSLDAALERAARDAKELEPNPALEQHDFVTVDTIRPLLEGTPQLVSGPRKRPRIVPMQA